MHEDLQACAARFSNAARLLGLAVAGLARLGLAMARAAGRR